MSKYKKRGLRNNYLQMYSRGKEPNRAMPAVGIQKGKLTLFFLLMNVSY